MSIDTVSFNSGGKNYIAYCDSKGYTLVLDPDGTVAEELFPGETLESNSKLYKGKGVSKTYEPKVVTVYHSGNANDSKPVAQDLSWKKDVKPCHVGLSKVFTWNGLNFYAGGWKDEKKDIVSGCAKTLLIDLDDNMKEPIRTFGLSKKAKSKMSGFEDMKCVKIAWPDFNVPALAIDFWEKLIEVITEEGRDVVVFCYGGHGRTGTCLAVLAALLKISDEPVKLIREKHCEKAVESWSQIEYIEEITGLEVMEKPAKSYNNNYSTGFGHGFGM